MRHYIEDFVKGGLRVFSDVRKFTRRGRPLLDNVIYACVYEYISNKHGNLYKGRWHSHQKGLIKIGEFNIINGKNVAAIEEPIYYK